MIKHLLNSRGETIYSNLPTECSECFENCNSSNQIASNCSFKKAKRRQGLLVNENGTAYMCTDDKDSLNSARIFREKLLILSELLSEISNMRGAIRDEVNNETKRLLHNLTSLNGHNIQEVYYILPQEVLSKDMNRQLQIARKYVKQSTEDVASALLRIAKNNMSMKTEFSVFNKLYETSPILDKKLHPIHKVLLNILGLFFKILLI